MKKIRFLTWFAIFSFFAVMGTTVFLLIDDSSANDPNVNKAPLLESHFQVKRANEPVAILFTGDIMLGRYIETLMGRKGGDFPFTFMPEIIEKGQTELGIQKFDLVVGNLEGPITEYGKNSLTSLIFNFKPATANLLKKVGFTTLNLANNHTLNQHENGLSDTRKYLTDAGLTSFGHPSTPASEFSFVKYQFKDVSVGLLGLDNVDFKLDIEQTNDIIKSLDSQVDFLVIGVHWGVEYKQVASDYIVNMSHGFVDNGADFIWGHHPHVIQNSEVYNGAPIYYSLGNFVFDQYFSPLTQEGLIVGLLIDGDKIKTIEFKVDLVNQGEPKPRFTLP